MSYRSKVDWWLGALLAAGLLGPMIAVILTTGTEEFKMVLLITVISILVVFAVGFPVRYTIGESELKIRCGLFVYEKFNLKESGRSIPHAALGALRPGLWTASGLIWTTAASF